MPDDEIRLEGVTISRYPGILDLAPQELSEHAHEGVPSELAPETPNTVGQFTRNEPWVPPVGEVPLDESLLEWIQAELDSGVPHSATWHQALVQAKGDMAAAKLAYVKLRMASLASVPRAA